MPARVVASASADAGLAAKPVQPANQHYLEAKPVDLEALAPARQKAAAALARTLDKHKSASDSMAALASALNDAPGSAVLAVELAKAARRAHDQNRLSHFRRIVERSLVAFPVVSKPAESIGAKRDLAKHPTVTVSSTDSDAAPMRKLAGVDSLEHVCDWLTTSFNEGHPPVDYVGEQSTDSKGCQQTVPQTFAPELQALTAIVRLGGADERVFAWVALRFNQSIWLSPVVAESFAPGLHPNGNGFSVELQRTEAYKAGLPEVTAYITDRSTVIDVALNEMAVMDGHRIVVMTVDGQAPQASAPVSIHTRVARSLLDSSDVKPPKGYKHSPDLGKTTESSFRLEWGVNSVRLIPAPSGIALTKTLFAEH
jgi:hypothetical protein